MKISTNWLKNYVDLDNINLKDLALKITKAGVNVEGVTYDEINGLIIGKILNVEPHNDSDHLNVCQVDVGEEVLQIVCGASNVRQGLKVIVALPGAVLPGNFEIKKSKIRGIESNGMICALYEIGYEEKTEENYAKGIAELNDDAPIGEDISLHVKPETIYTLDLNPNRNDCLSHLGFAYETAAVLKQKVILPKCNYTTLDEDIKDHFSLVVETQNCKLYNAKMVKDVVVGESPKVIKERLEAAGMRAINNIVDISNYVMLEYGQPLHFFDYDKLGNKIKVRMAESGEEAVTLDEKERTLSEKDIVITDGEKVVALAGVMGCNNSEIDENTKTIIIESAIFDPLSVRNTYKSQDLRSEASIRFEKGLSKEYCFAAAERACYLLEKYASGKVLSGTVTYDNLEVPEKIASVTLKEINSVLGMNLNEADVESSLNALDFKYRNVDSGYVVTIPSRRIDVEANKADLIEEIGRLYGYDNIPNVLPVGSTKTGVYVGKIKIRKQISKFLRLLGLTETRTYTLVGYEDTKQFNYNFGENICLLKPMSSDKSIFRQSILSSMLKVIDYNNARGVENTLLYEMANVYQNKNEEILKLAIAIKGKYINNSWKCETIESDFYLLKGFIERLFDYLGLKNRYSFEKNPINDLHPGICAEIFIDKEPVGFLGKVNPKVRKYDAYVSELDLNKILGKQVKPIKIKESSKYPEIKKDLAFVLKKNIRAGDIMFQIKKAGGRLLTNIDVFDVYEGQNIDENEKSIAFSLTFSDPTRTLVDVEVNEIISNIINHVENKFESKLRN